MNSNNSEDPKVDELRAELAKMSKLNICMRNKLNKQRQRGQETIQCNAHELKKVEKELLIVQRNATHS